ncbi:oligosaccharide flippase family protein [Salinicoccus roseus]|uniref:oligosaccharide flippase family protein n=1 Tax=Salinicoccus roseus TaxID=45670 RepID=UPI0035260C56
MANYLKRNVLNSIKWTSLVTLLNTIIQPFYRILLAALLLPTEFSYIAVIILIVSFAELLNNIGIGEALIQKDHEEVTTKDLSTLFFFNVIVAFIISIILFFNSGLIENFYNLPDLSLMIKLITPIVFLSGVTSIFKFYLHKKFKFRETSIIKMIKIVTEVLISIFLITIGLNVWGFVWGIIVANISNAILLPIMAFIKTDFKIRFYFSFNSLKNYMNFGIFVSLKKVITFISQRIDEIIIGGVLSAEVLGLYFLAKNLLVQLQTLITTSFGQVLLPAFSSVKSDRKKQKDMYLLIVSILFFVGTPIFTLLILSAELFVPLVFGDEWKESAEIFQWLSLPTFCLVLSAGVTTSILYSQAKTFVVLLIDLALVPLYIVALFLFNYNDLHNIMTIYIAYILIKFLVIQLIISQVLQLNLKDYIRIIRGTLFSGVSTYLFLYIFLKVPINVNDYVYLISFLIIGIVLYLTLNWFLNKSKFKNYYSIFRKIIKSS